ncbi:hypothetical protein ACQPZF_21985 [Actinosynnema sp. CS-041913]|uniref:hypothetical protein n=1 Tax=Actinosynnema sp. CS-041913 TaxID=3239917 RepID=UPI003D934AEF
MTDAPLDADVLDTLAAGFADVAADFADEVGGPPTLGEFLEVLGWAVPTTSAAVDGTFGEPLKLTATVKGNKRYRSESSRVPELNDSVFEEARSHNAALAERLAAASGGPITPQQYASALLQVLRADRIVLADVAGADVRKLVPEVSAKRTTKLTPGDVLTIPVEPSGYRLAVVITRNRFGTAIGLFEGVSPDGRPAVDLLRAPERFPVYTEESQVKNGAWRVVGHDENLLALFPADPEVYHKPGAWPGLDTGVHGAAEPADGPLRMIDEEEARAVGLQSGYRQTYPAAFLQKVLSGGR